MSVQYSGDKITFSDGSTLGSGWTGFKNRLINGDMRIAQRGTSVTNIGQDMYGACDRWKHWAADGSETGKCTMSQSTDVPSGQGFKYSTKLQVTTTQTPASTAGYKLVQRIEANNCAFLGFGESGAYITISFWAKAETKTGTYCVSLWFYGASSNKVIVREVSLTTSWAKYTITIPTDSTQDVSNGTGTGIELGIGLMAGSSVRNGSTSSDWVAGATASTYTANQVNFYDSTSNALYVTGVQLEKGSTATSFDYRPYGTELALCQRYAVMYKPNIADTAICTGSWRSTTATFNFLTMPVEMRTVPSMTVSAASDWGSSVEGFHGGAVIASTSMSIQAESSNKAVFIIANNAGSGTQYRPHGLQSMNTSSSLLLSAEL